ncbi:hypothetical protein I7I51_07597 [Histoplasma capsulatum]|uniref:Uncharacterized protein n=1 Tax=Ajellomyces capsulatus TaxID=5037 RepID=A0A8A1M0H6_AJECA|nr:hypothetical protein I7I51_07597 [Histoplasma capsulatum]
MRVHSKPERTLHILRVLQWLKTWVTTKYSPWLVKSIFELLLARPELVSGDAQEEEEEEEEEEEDLSIRKSPHYLTRSILHQLQRRKLDTRAGSQNAVEKVAQHGTTMPLGKDNGAGNGILWRAFGLSSWKISPGKVYRVWRQIREGMYTCNYTL